MCCFSGRVESVSGTRVFARRADERAQHLAYAMSVSAASELAMALPLPTELAAGEDAVSFVDLSGAPWFFDRLDALFSVWMGEAPASRGAPQGKHILAVHAVGDFEASFVPRAEDFERLDPRFRLAPAVVDALCAREPMGFAVFQLRGLGGGHAAPPSSWWKRSRPQAPPRKARRFHPMAFTFRSRTPEALFFPTVHVHDGTLPATARFDHTLYAQVDGASDWAESASAPTSFDVEHARGLLSPSARVRRTTITGEHPNRDVIVPA